MEPVWLDTAMDGAASGVERRGFGPDRLGCGNAGRAVDSRTRWQFWPGPGNERKGCAVDERRLVQDGGRGSEFRVGPGFFRHDPTASADGAADYFERKRG